MQLSATNAVEVNLEGLLAKAEGAVLNKVEKDGETQLLIQAKDFDFEASLVHRRKPKNLQLGVGQPAGPDRGL